MGMPARMDSAAGTSALTTTSASTSAGITGISRLQQAIVHGRVDEVRMLLGLPLPVEGDTSQVQQALEPCEHIFSPNAVLCPFTGRTALHWCLYARDHRAGLAILQVMLADPRTDLNLRNNRGLTALEVARTDTSGRLKKHTRLLVAAGAARALAASRARARAAVDAMPGGEPADEIVSPVTLYPPYRPPSPPPPPFDDRQTPARRDPHARFFSLTRLQEALAAVVYYLPHWDDINPVFSDLHFATRAGIVDSMECLLESGADPDYVNKDGHCALHLAILYSRREAFDLLLPVTDMSGAGRNVFRFACKKKHLEYVEALVESDLDASYFHSSYSQYRVVPNLRHLHFDSYEGMFAYCYLFDVIEKIYKRSQADVERLLSRLFDRGVAINPRDATECPPLAYLHCCEHKESHAKVIEMFVNHGCDVDYRRPSSKYPVPDVFLSSISNYGLSLPLLLTYSVKCEPEDIIRVVLMEDYGVSFHTPKPLQKILQYCYMSAEDYLKLTKLLFINYSRVCLQTDENFVGLVTPRVAPLKHICRKEFRKLLRTKVSTTQEFLNMLDMLELPDEIKAYMRYQ